MRKPPGSVLQEVLKLGLAFKAVPRPVRKPGLHNPHVDHSLEGDVALCRQLKAKRAGS